MTGIKNTNQRFGWMAAGLHWVVALLVIGLLCVGLYMTSLSPGAQMFQLYALHKSIGITVLALVLFRILWKIRNIHPAALATHKVWEKKLASFIHVALYVLLFVMPFSGWIMSSAKGFSVSVFGLFTLPDLVGPDKDLAAAAVAVHQFAAYGLIGAFLLHAGGAVKHALIDRDSTLARMIPFMRMSVMAAFMFMPVAAQAQTIQQWSIDAGKSSITFEGKQMGAAFEGKFSDFSGIVAFDPAHLDQSRIDVAIKTASISTGSPDRDSAIVGKEWFDVAAFPESVFTADKFEKIDDTHFIALGTLKIRSVSVPVKLPFTLEIVPDAAGQKRAVAMADVTLNRFDFGLGGAEWKDESSVGAQVKVHIAVNAPSVPMVAEKQ